MIFWAALWIVGIHYFQLNPGGTGLEVPINNIVWCFVALLVGTCCYKIITDKQILFSKLSIIFFVTVVLLSIPYIYPTDWFSGGRLTSESASRGIGLIAGFFLFISFHQLDKSTSTIARLTSYVVLGTGIEALLILIQFYLLTENNWLHYNITYRPYGIFQQVNVAASFMAIGIILPIFALLQQKQTTPFSGWKYKIFLFSTFICSWSITLIQSRSGYLSLVFIIILGYCGSYMSHKEEKQIRYLWIILVVLGILLGSISLNYSKGEKRDPEVFSSVGIRDIIYSRSLEMFTEKPIIGWGYGNFEWNFLNHQATDYAKDDSIKIAPEGLEHPHNELLYWAVEGGLLPIVGIFLSTFYFFIQLKKSREKLLLLALLVPIVIHCMVELPFYHATSHWVLFLFFIWIADCSKKYTLPVNYTFALRLLTPILAVTTLFFMLTNLHTISIVRKYSKTGDDKDLSRIINPIGISDTLTSYDLAIRYNTGITTGNTGEINTYLKYLKEFVRYQPRHIFFKHYVMALLSIHQEEYAEFIKDENNYLFPKHQMRIENGQVISDTESNQ